MATFTKLLLTKSLSTGRPKVVSNADQTDLDYLALVDVVNKGHVVTETGI